MTREEYLENRLLATASNLELWSNTINLREPVVKILQEEAKRIRNVIENPYFEKSKKDIEKISESRKHAREETDCCGG